MWFRNFNGKESYPRFPRRALGMNDFWGLSTQKSPHAYPSTLEGVETELIRARLSPPVADCGQAWTVFHRVGTPVTRAPQSEAY